MSPAAGDGCVAIRVRAAEVSDLEPLVGLYEVLHGEHVARRPDVFLPASREVLAESQYESTEGKVQWPR